MRSSVASCGAARRDGAAVADIQPPAGEAVRRRRMAGQDHRPPQRQPAQAVQHLCLGGRDRDARSARRAAAAARSSGRRGRWRRAAPGRRTGHSRPRLRWCRAHPAARRRIRRPWRRAPPRRPPASVASGRAKRMLSRMRAGEQHRALADPGGEPRQRLRHEVGDVGAVDRHAAPVGPHETQQDLDHGRFAGAGRARRAPASRPPGTRNDSPFSAGPRAGSQVRCTSSNATVTPCARHRADLARGLRCAAAAADRQRLGRAGGVQPVLIGRGKTAQRREELRRPAAARTARRLGLQQAAGQQRRAVAQRQHARRRAPRQDRARPRTGRRRAAPAWCAAAIRPRPRRASAPRPPPARRARWWRCPARGRGSAPAAGPAPGTGCATPPPRRARQPPWRPEPAARTATGTSAASGSAASAASATSSGPTMASAAAGSQRATGRPAPRCGRPRSRSVRRCAASRSCAGPACEQPGQRVGAQPPPCRRTGVECRCGRRRPTGRAQQRERRRMPARQQPPVAGMRRPMRSASSSAAHQAWPIASAGAEPAPTARTGLRRPAAGALFAAQPGMRDLTFLLRIASASRLAQTVALDRAGSSKMRNIRLVNVRRDTDASVHHVPAVRRQRGADIEAAIRPGQQQRGRGDLLGTAEAVHRQRVDERLRGPPAPSSRSGR